MTFYTELRMVQAKLVGPIHLGGNKRPEARTHLPVWNATAPTSQLGEMTIQRHRNSDVLAYSGENKES